MTTTLGLTATEILPDAAESAALVGRVWSRDAGGPCVVVLRGEQLFDLTPVCPSMAGLLERSDLHALIGREDLAPLGHLDDFLGGASGHLLAPVDLQAVKAAGVTFAESMLERVIEEQAGGDAARAREIRGKLAPVIGET